MGACDIVLNLRYPTVGESSGTLLRALGLGKAVMVSEVGSFQEFPDDVCLKVPVGPGEEDLIFEYLNLLVSRPDVAQALGARAKDYVARECNWAAVARRYAAFLEAVVEGREYREEAAPPAGGRPAARVRTRLARLPARMGGQQAGPRVPGNAPDAPGQDPRNHSARRRWRTASSKWARTCRSRRRCTASWAMAKCAGATTASRAAWITAWRHPPRASRSSATSIISTPRSTAFRIPTGISRRCCAAS